MTETPRVFGSRPALAVALDPRGATVASRTGRSVVHAAPSAGESESTAEVFAAVAALCQQNRRRSQTSLAVVAPVTAAAIQRVAGLPGASPRVLRRILLADPGRYLIGGREGVVIGGVQGVGDMTLVATVTREFAASAEALAENIGVRRVIIVPAATLLLPDEALPESESVELSAVRDDAGRVIGVQRTSGRLATSPIRRPSLEILAARALTSALAGPLVVTREILPAEARRSRFSTAAVAAALAGTIAFIAPGLRAAARAQSERAALSALEPERRTADSLASELGRSASALNGTAVFESSDRDVLPILSDFARRLPPGAALASLDLDTLGGTAVIVAPHAAEVLDALDDASTVTSVRANGPITPELINAGNASTPAQTVERLTITFRRAGR